jgi:valyl-tRNA synthetase
MVELESTYNPKQYEKKWWDFWQKNHFFEANRDSKKTPYVIAMPPPNVTDRLHMGHGLNNTIQDILIRWKRMLGFDSCWIPGVDHAGIATQMMVEKSLEKEGLSRKSLGREAFLKKLWDWKEKNGGIIIEQLKCLGCSADWRREAFTMSPTLSRAVRKIFVDLYNEGLIYKGERLVNWDPVLKTAISDDEVENEEINGHLWYFKYP